MWPGLVGKGSPGAEPCIDLDAMLDLTAKASVDGARFDGWRECFKPDVWWGAFKDAGIDVDFYRTRQRSIMSVSSCLGCPIPARRTARPHECD